MTTGSPLCEDALLLLTSGYRTGARIWSIVDGFGSPYSPAYLQTLVNRWWSDRHARRLVEG